MRLKPLHERVNGRLFREVEFALPKELNEGDQVELAREFASSAWNLSSKLRRVPLDGRKEIENLVDQEISRLSAKSVNPPKSGEGE